MAAKPVQKLLPFGEPAAESHREGHAEAVRYEPSEEAMQAIEHLRSWLTDPRTGRMTEAGGETMRAVEKALVEGRNAWWHAAEDGLEMLRVRNGKTDGDDIPKGLKGEDFQQAVEDVLDALQDRWVGRER